MTASFDVQQVLEHIRFLSETIGPRFSGSPADQRATEYIHQYYAGLGLKVEDQTFDLTSGVLKDYGMEVLEPHRHTVSCHPFLFSSETGRSEIEGDLVFLQGYEPPQVGSHLKDKIVVWTWPGLEDIIRNYQEVVRIGPKAIVILTGTLGTDPSHLQMPANLAKPYQKLPTFFIRFEDGLELFREKASRARLFVEIEQHPGQTRNVIADLPGSEFPQEIILIGGHHDSVYTVPGAMDNAAGTAIVMELARIYAERGSKRSLRFIAWGAEEFGLWGSKHYFKLLEAADKEERSKEGFYKERDKTELDRHVFVVSVDVAGVALSADVCFVLGSPDINATLAHLAKELGLPHIVKTGYYGTNSLTFSTAGIPSISYASVEGPAVRLMHTPADNMEIIDPEHLQRSGEYLDTFIQRSIAGACTWPFTREVPEEQKKEIASSNEPFKWLSGATNDQEKPK